MGSASLQFLAYGFAVAVVFNVNRSLAWRQYVLLAASVGFLGFFTLNFLALLPLAGFLTFGFVGVRFLQARKVRAFVPLLILAIVAFFWLKKYAFIPQPLFIRHSYLTLGLSYIFFRVLHLLIDSRTGALPRNIGVVSYLNYTLNFTTLVSGPIQRYEDFAEMQLAPVPLPLNLFVASRAIQRIIIGFFKVNVLSLFLSMVHTSALHSLELGDSAQNRLLTGVTIAGVYPLYLYCNFSGYIDMVIGLARFLRIELPENFNRPFSSDNFMTFWNRWHITLSNWLKTYVYTPLVVVLMRRWPSSKAEPYLGVFAFFVTFFLIGLWHGQTSVFIFYGLLLGLGISVAKLHQILMARWLGRRRYSALSRQWLYDGLARGLTFTWFAFSLLWFWSNWSQLGILARSFSAREMTVVWFTVFLGASVVLTTWEALRTWLLSFSFENRPLLYSRYIRTVELTAVVVITTATLMLLSAPAPDIVYKAF